MSKQCGDEWAGQGGGWSECIQVHRYAMSNQCGDEWAGRGGECGQCVQVHRYTMSNQLGEVDAASVYRYTGTLRANGQVEMHREEAARLEKSMRRACTGTPVHYEQTVREENAASVYGYTGTL